MSPAPPFVGSEVKRLEDPRLIRGQAQYTDDLVVSGLAHAAVVRSPHAHARLARIDVTRAAAHPGVLAVFTARDLAGEMKLGVTHIDMPLRPEKVWTAMRKDGR